MIIHQTQNEKQKILIGFTYLTPKTVRPVYDKTTLRSGDHVFRNSRNGIQHGIVHKSSSDYLEIAFSEGTSIGTGLFSYFSEGKQVYIVEYEEFDENHRRETLHRLHVLLMDAGIFNKYQKATEKNRNNLALLCINGPVETGEDKYVFI